MNVAAARADTRAAVAEVAEVAENQGETVPAKPIAKPKVVGIARARCEETTQPFGHPCARWAQVEYEGAKLCAQHYKLRRGGIAAAVRRIK